MLRLLPVGPTRRGGVDALQHVRDAIRASGKLRQLPYRRVIVPQIPAVPVTL